MAVINKKKKVLVVDDDEAQLSTIEAMLKTDFDVATVKSGKETLEYLTKNEIPDIILLDILMPQMDGWETFNTIRGISLLKDVPIAFITSLGENEETRAFSMGAVDYIEKPLYKDDLINRLKKAMC